MISYKIIKVKIKPLSAFLYTQNLTYLINIIKETKYIIIIIYSKILFSIEIRYKFT